MSQRKAGTPVGKSSYTPERKPAQPRKSSGIGGTTIAMGAMGVLLILILGAGWWLNSNPNAPVVPTTVPVVRVWDYSNATLNGITVQTITNTTTVEYTDHWVVTAPVQADADELTVQSVASTVKALTAQSKVSDNPTDLGQFGLASPAMTVTAVLSGITPPAQSFLVGNASVDGGAYYVKTTISPTVYLVSNSSIEPLRAWLEAPPIALPTSTPIAAEIITPTLTPTITVTSEVSTTGTPAVSTTGTPTTAAAASTPLATGTTLLTPTVSAAATVLQGTAVVTGTQPLPGTSPVSTQPAGSPEPSPAASGSGGGTAGTPGVVESPTP